MELNNASVVENFYGRESGWHMFDINYLTTAVNAYLCAEKAQITNIMQQQKVKIDEFIEVGCGYGRYLPLITSQHINYCGIDLVSWLVAVGKTRLPEFQMQSGGHARIEVCSVDNLRDLLIANDRDENKKFCVFFPFNCFGNLPQPRQVLAHLSKLNATIIISGFLPDTATTVLRQDYYAKCGCACLQIDYSAQGTTITSADGLNSLAYHPAALDQLLNECGFQLTERYRTTENSEIALFSPIAMQNTAADHQWRLCGFSDEDPQSGLMQYRQSVAVILHASERSMIVRTENMQWRKRSLVWLASSAAQVADEHFICGTVQKIEPVLNQSDRQIITISTSQNTHSL